MSKEESEAEGHPPPGDQTPEGAGADGAPGSSGPGRDPEIMSRHGLDKLVPVVDVSPWVAPVDTSKWVTGLDLSKLAPVIEVSRWVAGLGLDKLVPVVDVSPWVAPVDTSKWVTGINWSKLAPVIDVSRWVTPVDTSRWVTGLDLSTWTAAVNASRWVTGLDTSTIFAGIDPSDVEESFDWKHLVEDVDWRVAEENIRDVESNLDQALEDESPQTANLVQVVERLELAIQASGQQVTMQQSRTLAVVAIGIYISCMLALHISNAATTEDPVFDAHKFLSDQMVAIGLALSVYGTFRKK